MPLFKRSNASYTFKPKPYYNRTNTYTDYNTNLLPNLPSIYTLLKIIKSNLYITLNIFHTNRLPNLPPQARHLIRVCRDFPEFSFETYNKRQFVKRFGITMYVTRDNANLPLKRIMRSVFYKHPDLKSAFEAIHVSKFVDNPPDFNPSRRSRIGDIIYLLDSPTLADKLRHYPEDFKFQCGGGFTVTLKGGIRGTQSSAQFTKAFSSSVMLGATAEAMRNAQQTHAGS